MKSTTIAISANRKRDLDIIREKLCMSLDTKVSYSYAIKYVLEKNNTEDHGTLLSI
jgi:hypothetical protein